MWTHWLRQLVSPARTRKPSPRRAVRRAFGHKLFVEVLEDRIVPSTFTVTNLGDSGTGTGNAGDLRYCINLANQNHTTSGKPDLIVFAQGLTGTIQLS